jgi:hypothetical protein
MGWRRGCSDLDELTNRPPSLAEGGGTVGWMSSQIGPPYWLKEGVMVGWMRSPIGPLMDWRRGGCCELDELTNRPPSLAGGGGGAGWMGSPTCPPHRLEEGGVVIWMSSPIGPLMGSRRGVRWAG